jgi:carboxymethylenebutenolidase
MEKLGIKTREGTVDCYKFYPEAEGKYPAVIIYMDAYGIRPGLLDMAQRLAEAGYYVIVPNLYYRMGDMRPFDPRTAFTDESERERIRSAITSATIANVMEDTGSILEYLNTQPKANISDAGTVGYCMGGKFALSAAAYFPAVIKAAASFHGGNLATDKDDSPHRLAGKMKGEIYIGVAELDKGFTSEERLRLEDALSKAGTKFYVEVYPGAAHGFAVNDSTVYKQDSAELHWQKLLDLFKRNL